MSLAETNPRITAPRLHRELTCIFPDLATVRVSHSWAGFVAYTFDTIAHKGTHDGVDYALGYCGSGVVLSGYLGMRCGQRVIGLAEGKTAFDDFVSNAAALQRQALVSGAGARLLSLPRSLELDDHQNARCQRFEATQGDGRFRVAASRPRTNRGGEAVPSCEHRCALRAQSLRVS